MFSPAVKLGDLNDFIAPSQACVVSLGGSGSGALQVQTPLQEEGHVQLQPRQAAVGFQQTYSDQPQGPVKVTLRDCLACSGCVTSAETVLLQHQSSEEFEQQLHRLGAKVVVSVSPQSRASLAALHGIPAAEVQARLTAVLKAMGVQLVLDIGPAREMALTEASAEFLDRYQRSKQASTSAPAAAAAGGAASGAQITAAGRWQGAGGPTAAALPMLASACPGWVVYAEKTHGEYILPYLSTTKSPQGVMGTLVKRHLAPSLGWNPDDVYHVTVMPCYDKKLEAVREDFVLPGSTTPEVDCTLTTGELQELLERQGYPQLAAAPVAPQLDSLAGLLQLLPSPVHPAGAKLLSAPQPEPAAAPPAAEAPAPSGGAAAAVTTAGASGLQAANGTGPPLNGSNASGASSSSSSAPMDVDEAETVGNGQLHGQPVVDAAHHPHQQQQLQQPAGPLQHQLIHLQQQQQASAGGSASELQAMHRQPGGSGGYMEHIFRAAAAQLFGLRLNSDGPLQTKVLRNADFQELLLLDSNGNILLRFAAAYGFRNIQTLMRKIKLGRCEYDYVEVMACPGGCLNGAGQIKPREGQTAAQLLQQLEMLYYVPPEPASATGDAVGSTTSDAAAGAAAAVCNGSSTAAAGADGGHQGQGSCSGQRFGAGVRYEPGVVRIESSMPLEQAAQQQQQPTSSSNGGGAESQSGVAAVAAKGLSSSLCRSSVAAGLYVDWIGDLPGSAAAKQLLHTQYRHRQKTASAAVGDW